MDENDEERTKRKFEVAYWIAKTNSPVTLYNETLKLGKHHVVFSLIMSGKICNENCIKT